MDFTGERSPAERRFVCGCVYGSVFVSVDVGVGVCDGLCWLLHRIFIFLPSSPHAYIYLSLSIYPSLSKYLSINLSDISFKNAAPPPPKRGWKTVRLKRSPPPWMDDKEAVGCLLCEEEFTVFNRKVS